MEVETDDFVVKRLNHRVRPYIVLAAAVSIQLTMGFMLTFGNMLPYLLSYLRWKVNPLQESGSLLWNLVNLPFAFLVGGILERLAGTRASVIIGCLVYTSSLASCYFTVGMGATWLFLSMGVGTSLGMGIVYNCVLIEAKRWIPNHLGLAGGIIGSSFIGGVVFLAPIQTLLINPKNVAANSDGIFTQVELLERIPSMFLTFAAFYGVIQIIASLFIATPRAKSSMELEEERALTNAATLLELVQYPSVSKKSALQSTTFYAIATAFFFKSISNALNGAFYKVFGETFIDDDFFLSTIISYTYVVNCFSQMFWGALTRKISCRTLMTLGFICESFLIWTLIAVRYVQSANLYLITFSTTAFFGGAVTCTIPYILHRCFGAKNFGIIHGFIHINVSLGTAVASLVSQYMLAYLGLSGMFVVSGASTFAGFLISLFIHRTKYGGQLAMAGDNSRRKLAQSYDSNITVDKSTIVYRKSSVSQCTALTII